ncbi:MAG: hypothetical protein M3083_00410 [Actinomycetota bacterium]|nr:hypothetical protein [Actinomycetota bacterium]
MERRELRVIEAEFRRQRLEREDLPATDADGWARVLNIIESIEKALQRSNSNLAACLTGLPDEHLLDVLGRVFAQRVPIPRRMRTNHSPFFLGDAKQMLDDDGVTWGPWRIGAVAYPDRSVYGGGLGPDWGFCQIGDCRTCGTNVRSNVQQGVCSVCGGSVGMT